MSTTSTVSHSSSTPRVCIVGAGMSGILMAIKLLEQGFNNFVIYEKANCVAGTWRQNRYPGVACDVASFTYCYSFEPNPNWSHRFSPGNEIRDYFERVVDKYNVRPYIQFNTEVTKAEYKNSQWHVESSDCQDKQSKANRSDNFDIYIAATGPLNNPNYPNIKGLDDFKGACFHTADWDDDYDYSEKRVGIIGTGSSAVQTVEPISSTAKKLTIFQRTAQWVVYTENPRYSVRAIKLKHKFPVLGRLTRSFFHWMGEQFGQAALHDGFRRKLVFKACAASLNKIKDLELRKKLTPDYLPMCRRMIMSGSFHQAVQRSNVSVETTSIDHITPEGIKTTDGKLHELDLLILATGFYFNVNNVKHIIGLDGQSLQDYWQNGIKTYRSITVPGFPNYFMLIGPTSPITNLSLIEIAEIGVSYVMQAINQMNENKLVAITPKASVTDQLSETLRAAFGDTIWTSGCSSWYLDNEGIPATWPWSPAEYHRQLSKPDFDEYDLLFAP